jgi:hypothetical protein
VCCGSAAPATKYACACDDDVGDDDNECGNDYDDNNDDNNDDDNKQRGCGAAGG